MANEAKKKIKILSRGVVLTSRGMARTPIDRPYLETISAILIMLTRYKADIVEVLPDGREVKLTIMNFNCDNSSVKEEVKVPQEPVKEEEVPVQPAISKNMSRKERKRLEAERRRAEQNAAAESHAEEAEAVVTDEIIVPQVTGESTVTDESVNSDVVSTENDITETENVESVDIENDELPEVPVE